MSRFLSNVGGFYLGLWEDLSCLPGRFSLSVSKPGGTARNPLSGILENRKAFLSNNGRREGLCKYICLSIGKSCSSF